MIIRRQRHNDPTGGHLRSKRTVTIYIFRRTDDGYRGYNIENGEVVEYYDHRSEFVPNPVVVEPRPKGMNHIISVIT